MSYQEMQVMGRRSDLQQALAPFDEKLLDIIAGSGSRGMRYSTIMRQATQHGISKATASRYLPKLVTRGFLKKEDLGNQHTVYKLAKGSIRMKPVQRSLFSILAMHLFNDVIEGARTGGLSDEEFTRRFTTRIGVLGMYTLLTGLSMNRAESNEAGKWIDEAFGTLVQKEGWRICLNRQIFGQPIPLRHPITLKTPIKPDIIVEEGTIYVKLPESNEPGLTARVLRELDESPKDRVNDLKDSMEKMYPEEIQILNRALSMIRDAAKTSEKR